MIEVYDSKQNPVNIYDGIVCFNLDETEVKDNIEINPETHETKEVTKYQYDTYEVKLDKYDRDSLINALIGTKYSISDQIALNRHMVNNDTQYSDAWNKFDSFCEKCKKIIDGK